MRRLLLSAAWIACAAVLVWADGGTLQFRKPAGAFVVSVFSEPVPVRVGVADLSVMVERASDQSPVLDGHVLLRLKKMDAGNVLEVAAPATHAKATNKLLYAASVTLPSAGLWQATVDLRAGGQEASASGSVNVLQAEAPVTAHWTLFALVPLMILLFGLNQWLKRRRKARRV